MKPLRIFEFMGLDWVPMFLLFRLRVLMQCERMTESSLSTEQEWGP